MNDAEAIAQALQRLDFRVLLGRNLDPTSMELVVQEFVDAARGADAALLFYAGHGFQLDGENYLVPISAHQDLLVASISLATVVDRLEDAAATNTLIFIDACRRSPLRGAVGKSGGDRSFHADTWPSALRDGLAEVHAKYGTLIVFSAAPGHVAYDGKGGNSPFTRALLRHIEMPNVGVQAMLTQVRTEVMRDTDDRQVPWDQSSLTSVFYFNRESPILSW